MARSIRAGKLRSEGGACLRTSTCPERPPESQNSQATRFDVTGRAMTAEQLAVGESGLATHLNGAAWKFGQDFCCGDCGCGLFRLRRPSSAGAGRTASARNIKRYRLHKAVVATSKRSVFRQSSLRSDFALFHVKQAAVTAAESLSRRACPMREVDGVPFREKLTGGLRFVRLTIRNATATGTTLRGEPVSVAIRQGVTRIDSRLPHLAADRGQAEKPD
jgi:hypothetical protein